ncbi:aminoglycoside phosphotransferase family protein [Paramagnetospirillum magneticum]|uniref:Predicted phosphotransferase related to Ser/Thr protein kinase n=1 Tax=Paramagnetospirillum magneticum (strain ATCC 700264 / AMB-1) TaxID=342108 RepID=Q2VZC3_PARM1|nr:phosphotransferase [Paramagnetospirillum magneticum]BAE53052.1 Predicted phosphotransferase related to Ser/Thr protein kinase [Paramagnetospirillum magneticum AMB-1]
MSERENLIQDFLAKAGWGAARRGRLAGDASFRHYDRLVLDGKPAVLMDAPPPKEDVRPFVRIARHLREMGLSAPALLAVDEENGLLLLEDLGDGTYTRLLEAGHDEPALYRLATDVLAEIAARPDSVLAGTPPYDDEKLLTEACLLTDWYMPAISGHDTDAAVRAEYVEIWTRLFPVARMVPDTLVLRDFHVDNLLLLDRPGLAACGLLDFQDAVIGPATYDLMSLLEDARRDIDPVMIEIMKGRWLRRFPHLDRAVFEASWAVMAAQRHAKVIGIFTRLCKRDGKFGYLIHIPRLWRLLEASCRHPVLAELSRWLDRHIPKASRGVPSP